MVEPDQSAGAPSESSSVRDDPVTRSLRAAPREQFLRPEERAAAADDVPLPIGAGQTCSQPRTVVAMLRLLDVRPGQSVLDVGAGSGWTTALLANLVGSTGSVVGVELLPDLARWGAENLAALRLPWASIRPAQADVLGWPATAPYDRVLVSAGAKQLPQPLVEQLRPEGVLVVPVSGQMMRVRLLPDGSLDVSEHGAYRFVPLK